MNNARCCRHLVSLSVSESVGGALLLLALPLHGLLPHLLHLLLARLQQQADPVRVVVHREVGQPRAGVRVHHDLQREAKWDGSNGEF